MLANSVHSDCRCVIQLLYELSSFVFPPANPFILSTAGCLLSSHRLAICLLFVCCLSSRLVLCWLVISSFFCQGPCCIPEFASFCLSALFTTSFYLLTGYYMRYVCVFWLFMLVMQVKICTALQVKICTTPFLKIIEAKKYPLFVDSSLLIAVH